ncbi:MAG: hypothetical protein U5R06_21450 [candidate division KSB1 bacterium]|nr:hypothetical protein [candidate division KSB1 bacterium]
MLRWRGNRSPPPLNRSITIHKQTGSPPTVPPVSDGMQHGRSASRES